MRYLSVCSGIEAATCAWHSIGWEPFAFSEIDPFPSAVLAHHYLLMCNMPFFAERLEWGASVRGAWWGALPGKPIEFQSCGLWVGDEQLHQTMKFSQKEWEKFVAAVVEFAAEEMKPNAALTGAAKGD